MPQIITRRRALQQISASALLACGAWPGALAASAKAGGTFRFIAVNDLHHDAPECNPWFERLMRQMRRHDGVEFVLVLGDLTDKAAKSSFGAIRDHFNSLGKPIHVQIGNHDHASAKDRTAYEEAFPKQLNYAFEHRGWNFLGIDSTQGTDSSNTRVQPSTLQWLDEQLPRLDRSKPTLVFTHFPLGPGAPMVPVNADAVLQKFIPFNLKGVYSGHHHGFTLRVVRGVDVLTNRCCARIRNNHDGSQEKGYWLVEAGETGLSRQFVTFDGAA